jgi:protein TonB
MILERIRYGFLSRMRRPEGIAPLVQQNVLKRLGMSPQKLFELSLSLSLLIVILLFEFTPTYTPRRVEIKAKQEFVKFEDVEHTRQENRPPPPPRPPIPIEAPGDESLEDVPVQSSELNVAAEVPPPPSPSTDDNEEYFVAVEEMPQIVGGIESIQRNVVYPELAIRAGVQGRVFVMAYVNTDGTVSRAEVVKGIGAGCDEAAVAAVMKAKFIPGKQRGRPVKVKVSIPIIFRLRTS